MDTALAAICQRVGLDPRGATLVKFTNNAVYRLAAAPVVVRIAGSPVVRSRVPKVIAVARWLAEHGVPAVRLVSYVDQPVVAGGHVATVWHAVGPVAPAPTAADLGAVLLRFHALPAPTFALPPWQPVATARRRIADAAEIARSDTGFLTALCDEVEAELAGLTFTLPPGPIHGDATVGNLVAGQGGIVMCDFDSAALGPREWDLTPVAAGAYRFDRTGIAHARLAAAYGFDVTAWPGFPALRRLRELQLVTSVLPVLGINPGLVPQWTHRVRTLRNRSDASWQPYR